MNNIYEKPIRRTTTVTYVADSERDAERLRGQVDAPVRVKNRHYQVTIDATAIEGIGVSAAEIAHAPAAPATTERLPL